MKVVFHCGCNFNLDFFPFSFITLQGKKKRSTFSHFVNNGKICPWLCATIHRQNFIFLREAFKRWALHGNNGEPSHNRETDRLEITEAKSQKIDHIQQNGRSD